MTVLMCEGCVAHHVKSLNLRAYLGPCTCPCHNKVDPMSWGKTLKGDSEMFQG